MVESLDSASIMDPVQNTIPSASATNPSPNGDTNNTSDSPPTSGWCCSICGKTWARKDAYVRHQRHKHGLYKEYKCHKDVCANQPAFTRYTDYRRHMSFQHNINLPIKDPNIPEASNGNQETSPERQREPRPKPRGKYQPNGENRGARPRRPSTEGVGAGISIPRTPHTRRRPRPRRAPPQPVMVMSSSISIPGIAPSTTVSQSLPPPRVPPLNQHTSPYVNGVNLNYIQLPSACLAHTYLVPGNPSPGVNPALPFASPQLPGQANPSFDNYRQVGAVVQEPQAIPLQTITEEPVNNGTYDIFQYLDPLNVPTVFQSPEQPFPRNEGLTVDPRLLERPPLPPPPPPPSVVQESQPGNQAGFWFEGQFTPYDMF